MNRLNDGDNNKMELHQPLSKQVGGGQIPPAGGSSQAHCWFISPMIRHLDQAAGRSAARTLASAQLPQSRQLNRAHPLLVPVLVPGSASASFSTRCVDVNECGACALRPAAHRPADQRELHPLTTLQLRPEPGRRRDSQFIIKQPQGPRFGSARLDSTRLGSVWFSEIFET